MTIERGDAEGVVQAPEQERPAGDKPAAGHRSTTDYNAPQIDAARKVVVPLEESYPVNQLRYREMRIWPAIRSMLLFYYGERRGSLAEPPAEKLALPSLPRLISTIGIRTARLGSAFEQVLSGNPFAKDFADLQQSELLFVGRRGTRSLLVEKRAFDVQIDPIIALIDGKRSWTKLLSAPREMRGERTYYPTRTVDLGRYMEWLGGLGRLNDIAFPHRASPVSGWSEFAERMRSIDGFPPLPSNAETVRNYCRTIDGLSGFYEYVLEAIAPKLVVFVGQNANAFAIALACYRRRIPCVDIQHGAGAASQGNLKWFGWRQVPAGGYELLPDYFFVWSKAAAERIDATMGGSPGHHVPVVGGDQWLTLCQQLIPDTNEPRGAHQKLRILVTLTQRSVGDIPELVLEAIEKAPKDWRWMLRLHPEDTADPKNVAMMKERLDGRQLANVEVHKASNRPLPQMLKLADRHVTMYSSTCLEATAFGLPTIFTDRRAAELLPDIVGQPGFPLALTCDELIEALSAGFAGAVAPLVESGAATGLAAIEMMIARGANRGDPGEPHP